MKAKEANEETAEKTEKRVFVEGWVQKGNLVTGMVDAFTASW